MGLVDGADSSLQSITIKSQTLLNGDANIQNHTLYVEERLSDQVFFINMWDCQRHTVSRVVGVNLKDIGVEFVDN